MAHKHSVTYEGFTFKRTSQNRVYTHTVISRRSRAADRAQTERSAREMWKLDLAHYAELAGGVHKLSQKYPAQYTPERIAKDVAKAKAWVEKGEQGHVDEHLAFLADRVAKLQTAADGDTYYRNEGWCSRADLAQKLAARTPNAIILEVK